MDESWKNCAKWKKAGHQRPRFLIPLMWKLQNKQIQRRQKTEYWLPGSGVWREGGVTANVLKLDWVIVTYLCECTKKKIELYNLKGLVYGIWNISQWSCIWKCRNGLIKLYHSVSITINSWPILFYLYSYPTALPPFSQWIILKANPRYYFFHKDSVFF